MVGIGVKAVGMIVHPGIPGMPRCQWVLDWGPVWEVGEDQVIFNDRRLGECGKEV